MPLFREVGSRLKEKFDGAAKVIPGEFSDFFTQLVNFEMEEFASEILCKKLFILIYYISFLFQIYNFYLSCTFTRYLCSNIRTLSLNLFDRIQFQAAIYII